MPEFIVRATTTQYAEFRVRARSVSHAIEKVEDGHDSVELVWDDWGEVEATSAYPVESNDGA